MMNTTDLFEIVKAGAPMVQTFLQVSTGTLLTTLFLRNNTKSVEFEKIKAGKFTEVVDNLLEGGKMTYYEFYKCRNFLEIAKIADKEIKQTKYQLKKDPQLHEEFDFDWFVRFFDSAGNIRNEEMQELWAKILAGEVRKPGSFSLRTLEKLRNMTQKEAELFRRIAEFILKETDGTLFLFCDTDFFEEDFNERYGICNSDILALEECGLLSALRMDNHMSFSEDIGGFLNDNIVLLFEKVQGNEKYFKYKSYALTQTAIELLKIAKENCNDEYVLELGRMLKKIHDKNISITAYRIISIEGDEINCDTNLDLLLEEL